MDLYTVRWDMLDEKGIAYSTNYLFKDGLVIYCSKQIDLDCVYSKELAEEIYNEEVSKGEKRNLYTIIRTNYTASQEELDEALESLESLEREIKYSEGMSIMRDGSLDMLYMEKHRLEKRIKRLKELLKEE